MPILISLLVRCPANYKMPDFYHEVQIVFRIKINNNQANLLNINATGQTQYYTF